MKLFFHHGFELYGSPNADTAMFDPDSRSIIHYKAKRYFLVSGATERDSGIAEYSCGRAGIGDSEGTWRDAEDGELSMNAIQQGAVDSTIALPIELEPLGSHTAYYWICAGERYGDVRKLDRLRASTKRRRGSSPAPRRSGTRGSTNRARISAICPRRSSICIAARCWSCRRIAITAAASCAAADSDIEWGHNDHYAYVWPRDGAFVADAMDRAGFHQIARRFLQFAHDTISNDGYFLHKYAPDGSLASSWNPWVRNGKKQLPIQEDATALVLWLLARHYDRTRDLEFIRSVYQAVGRCSRPISWPASAIRRRSLPLPSFDMWEERQGVFTFTAPRSARRWSRGGDLANLFNEQERRSALPQRRRRDPRCDGAPSLARRRSALRARTDAARRRAGARPHLDASTFATFFLGVFPRRHGHGGRDDARHPRDARGCRPRSAALRATQTTATSATSTTTIAIPGNPWLICTLWLAEHAIARATSVAELQSALDLFAGRARRRGRRWCCPSRCIRTAARRCRFRRFPGVTRRSFRSSADTSTRSVFCAGTAPKIRRAHK